MKRYITIATVLAVLLIAAFTGGALAQEEGVSLETVGKALAELTDRINGHEEQINGHRDRIKALEEFVAALPTPAPTPLPTPTPTPTMPESASLIELVMYLVDRDAAYEGGGESRMPFGSRSDTIAQTAHILPMTTAQCKHISVRETAEMVDRFAITFEEAGVTAEALGWADHRSLFRFRGLVYANASEEHTCRQLLELLAEAWISEYKASQE